LPSAALRKANTLLLAFANRGDAYRDKGEFQRALADYFEAVRI
jgi:hypothetical protein